MVPNRLYMFEVVKKEEDKDCLVLRLISNTHEEIFALIKKTHLIKDYNVGDTLLATAKNNTLGKYREVSQKIPAHIINLLEIAMPIEERKRLGIYFSRVGSINSANICKVGVWGRASRMDPKELNDMIHNNPYIIEIREHLPTVFFIPAEDTFNTRILTKRFAINAFHPAPIDRIQDVYIDEEKRECIFYISQYDFPLLLWKNYINGKLVAKLLKAKITLKATDSDHSVSIRILLNHRESSSISENNFSIFDSSKIR